MPDVPAGDIWAVDYDPAADTPSAETSTPGMGGLPQAAPRASVSELQRQRDRMAADAVYKEYSAKAVLMLVCMPTRGSFAAHVTS